MTRKRRGDQTSQQVSGKARKIARKEERKSKKQRRANFQKNKNSKILEDEAPKQKKQIPQKIIPSEPEEIEMPKRELTTIEKEMKIVKREKKKHRKKMVKSREMTIEDLQAGIDEDDAIIRNMERKLGIKKKKKKELTTSDEIRDSLKIFGDEVVDDDLESAKKAEGKSAAENFTLGENLEEDDFSGDDDEAFGEFDDDAFEENSDEEAEENDEEDLDSGNAEDSELMEDDSEPESNEEDEEEELKGFGDEPSDSDGETDEENTEIFQAIYGEESDSEELPPSKSEAKEPSKEVTSEPISKPEVKKYIPPALRAQNNALERLVRGHLNKLSSSNLYAIVQEFQSIFRNNPRKEVSSIITSTIFNQVIQSSQTPHLLVEDYSSFLMSIHYLVSEEITGFFVEDLINKFFELNEENSIDMFKMKNLLALTCTLTRLKLFNVKLVLEIFKEFTKRFSPDDIEFIQLILLQCAFTIRKEAPAELKSIIIDVHSKVNEKSDEIESVGGSRAKFMLEMLLNVKNNNLNAMKAHPGFIESERDQNCKKRIRAVVGQVQIEPFSAVGLSDIIDIPKRGRWWRVGASVTVIRDNSTKKEVKKVVEVSEKLKAAARKLRLNTDNKRSVFYLLNTCMDFMDAASKIVEMRLKGSQRQDVLFVILEIVMRLKKWNTFYVLTLEKLLQLDRSFLMPTQCAYWDKFSVLETLTERQSSNLGKFLAHAFQMRCIPITMLKKFDFTQLGEEAPGAFFKSVMKEMSSICSAQDVLEICGKLQLSSDLKDFRNAFYVFVQHHCVKNGEFMKALSTEQAKILSYISRNIKEKDEAFSL